MFTDQNKGTKLFIYPLSMQLIPVVVLCIIQAVFGGDSGILQNSDNAARDYLKAIDELAKIPEGDLVLPGPNDPLPASNKCEQIVSRLGPALKYLHEGTTKKECDWETDLNRKGAAATFPHIPKTRELAANSLFRARFRWQSDKRGPAINDVRAAIILARRVGDEGKTGLVGLTERYKIEQTIIQVLRLWMTDPASARSLDGLFRVALQTEKNLPKIGLLLETETILPWSRRLVAASDLTPEELKWRDHYFGQTLAQQGESWILQKIDEAKVHYTEVGDLMDLPIDQFIPKLDQYLRKLDGAGNPFSQVGIVKCPGIPAAYLQSRNMRTQWTILQAASGIFQAGPEAIKKTSDPYGQGPLHYEATADGFTLSSALVIEKKPVELRFVGIVRIAQPPRAN